MAVRSGGGLCTAAARGRTIAAMSTYHLPVAVRPLLAWTASYGARRRLWPVATAGASDLTPRDAAHVIRAIDAVCAAAPAADLPFEQFAALDELGAHLADWLRLVAPLRPPARPVL